MLLSRHRSLLFSNVFTLRSMFASYVGDMFFRGRGREFVVLPSALLPETFSVFLRCTDQCHAHVDTRLLKSCLPGRYFVACAPSFSSPRRVARESARISFPFRTLSYREGEREFQKQFNGLGAHFSSQVIWIGFFVFCSRGVLGGAGWLTLMGPVSVVS